MSGGLIHGLLRGYRLGRSFVLGGTAEKGSKEAVSLAVFLLPNFIVLPDSR